MQTPHWKAKPRTQFRTFLLYGDSANYFATVHPNVQFDIYYFLTPKVLFCLSYKSYSHAVDKCDKHLTDFYIAQSIHLLTLPGPGCQGSSLVKRPSISLDTPSSSSGGILWRSQASRNIVHPVWPGLVPRPPPSTTNVYVSLSLLPKNL